MDGRKISHNESEIFIAGQDWNNKDAIGKTIYVYDSSAGNKPAVACKSLVIW